VTTLRLLSYNVRSMRDDVDALARVMREIAPHVAIIQEAPRFLHWQSKCAALARRAGMVLVTGGRTSGANLVLSSLAVEVTATHELAFTADKHLHHRRQLRGPDPGRQRAPAARGTSPGFGLVRARGSRCAGRVRRRPGSQVPGGHRTPHGRLSQDAYGFSLGCRPGWSEPAPTTSDRQNR